MSSGVLRLASWLEYALLLAALPVAVYVCGTLAILLVHFIYILKVVYRDIYVSLLCAISV